MSDKPAEGAVGTQDTAAPTTPKFSAASTPATPSQPYNEDALLSKLMERLAPEIDKRFQSAKDKRLSAIDRLGGVDDLVKLKEYIKAKPTDPDGAIRDFQLDQLLAQAQAQPQSQVSPEVPVRTAPVDPSGDVQSWTTDILTEAGVDWNTDEAYKALAARPYATPDAWKTATVKFIAQRAKQGFQPGAATNQSVGPAAPPTPKGSKQERKDAIYARLDETQKEPTRFAGERAKLKAELKALD